MVSICLQGHCHSLCVARRGMEFHGYGVKKSAEEDSGGAILLKRVVFRRLPRTVAGEFDSPASRGNQGPDFDVALHLLRRPLALRGFDARLH